MSYKLVQTPNTVRLWLNFMQMDIYRHHYGTNGFNKTFMFSSQIGSEDVTF